MGNKTRLTHYKVERYCDNCGKPIIVTIRKGRTFSDYIKQIIVVCNYCGCAAFKK